MGLFENSSKKIYLHIGADKCGSSSIQYFLSQNKNLKNNSGEAIDYICIIPPGEVITQPEIFETTQKMVQNFRNSNFASKPYTLSKELRKNITNSMRKKISKKKNILLSSEGWLRGICNSNNFDTLLGFFNEKISYDIEILAVVRSPASWLNSAWWQWGVWNSKYKSFDDWLETAIPSTFWFKFLLDYQNNPLIKKIKIVSLEENLTDLLIKFLDLKENNNYNSDFTNFSLDKYFYKALLSIEKYKLNDQKRRRVFFLFDQLLKSYKYRSKTPWVLNRNHINRILEKTEAANLKLLNLVNNKTRTLIINNSEWWDISAFSDKKLSDPYLNDLSLDDDLTNLIYQLFRSNEKNFDFISSKSLKKEFIDYLSF